MFDEADDQRQVACCIQAACTPLNIDPMHFMLHAPLTEPMLHAPRAACTALSTKPPRAASSLHHSELHAACATQATLHAVCITPWVNAHALHAAYTTPCINLHAPRATCINHLLNPHAQNAIPSKLMPLLRMLHASFHESTPMQHRLHASLHGSTPVHTMPHAPPHASTPMHHVLHAVLRPIAPCRPQHYQAPPHLQRLHIQHVLQRTVQEHRL